MTEAPASVTIITAEEIERQGWRTLSDALRSVRGIFTTWDYYTPYVGVRGFNRPGDYNTRILLVLDGERVNENIYDGAYVGMDGFIELDLIDRIEVIRGPSSSLYGTNAFFGVINIISKRGRDLRGAVASADVGSYGTTGVRAAWGDRFTSGLEALVAVSRYRTDGPSVYFPEFDDPATNNGIADNNAARRNSFMVRLGLGDFSLDATGMEHVREIPTGAWETDFNSPEHRGRDWGGQVRLGFDRTFADAAMLSVSAGYHAYDFDGRYPYEGDTYFDWGHGRWWTVETRYVRPAGRHKLVLGAFFQRDAKVDQGAGYEGYELDFESDRPENVWAFFAQDEADIGPFLLNAGVRYDHYTAFGGSVNPRVALVWGMRDGSAVKLLHGTAFRAPNQYELYYNDGGNTQKAAEELDPETITTTELVVERPLGRSVNVSASLYHYRVEGLIVQTEDPADELLVFENLGAVKSTGAELEIDARLGRLDVDASWAFQRSRDVDTDETPANSPDHLLQLNTTTPITEQVDFSVGFRGMSSRIAPNGGTAPSYAVADLSLLARDLLPGVKLRATVYNVLDRMYYDVGGEEHLQRLLPQNGRNFRLAVDWTF